MSIGNTIFHTVIKLASYYSNVIRAHMYYIHTAIYHVYLLHFKEAITVLQLAIMHSHYINASGCCRVVSRSGGYP